MRKLLLMFIFVISVSVIYSQESSKKWYENPPLQSHNLKSIVQTYIKNGEDNYFVDKSEGMAYIRCYEDSCYLLIMYGNGTIDEMNGFNLTFLEKDLKEGKCRIKFSDSRQKESQLVDKPFIALDSYYYNIIKENKYLRGTFPLAVTFTYENKEYQFHLTCNVVEQKLYRR